MAMLKNGRISFSLIVVCLMVVSPVAKAQLASGLLGRLIGGIFSAPTITGVLFCTPNGALNGTASAPAFPNAGVQLQCGTNNTVVSNTTTNAAGLFSLPTGSIQTLVSTLLSSCRVVVTTPLAACNATLPSVGNLVSQLSLIGVANSGLLNVFTFVPTLFRLLN